MAEPVEIVYRVDTSEITEKIPKATAALDSLSAAASSATKPLDAAATSADHLATASTDVAAASTKAATATTAAGDAAKKTGDKAKESASKMDALTGGAKKLKGGLDMVIPGAGSVLSAFDDMADGAEGAGALLKTMGGSAIAGGVALGGLAVAVAAVTAAYQADAAAAARVNELRAFEVKLGTDLRGVEAGLAAAKLSGAVATGKMSEADAAALTIRRSAQAQIRDYLTGLNEERRAIEEQIASSQKYATAQKAVAAGMVLLYNLQGGLIDTARRAIAEGKTVLQVAMADVDAVNERLDAYTGLNQGMEINRQKVAAITKQGAEYVEVVKETTDETLKADKAERQRAAGLASTSEWLAKVNAGYEREAQLNREAVAAYSGAIAQFNAAENAALSAQIARSESETEAITRTKNERIAALTAVYDAERAKLEGNLGAQETLYQEYQRATVAIERDAAGQRRAVLAEEVATRTAAREAELKAAQELAEKEVAQRREVASAALSVTNDYLGLVGEGYAALAKKAGASQKEVFAITKAAAIAQAGIQTAQAVLNALATTPFPLTAAAVALAVTSGAVQIGKIAASKPPSYRGGGMIADGPVQQAAALPDARVISAETGEAILTRQGVQAEGGPEGVAARNAGMSPAPVEVNLRLGHETMQRVTVEQLQRPSALRAATTTPRARGVVNPYLSR